MQQSVQTIDIHAILQNRSLTMHFQPIVSVRRQELVGYEALARGIHYETKEMISPFSLFQAAQQADAELGMDRLCREKAVELYCQYRKQDDCSLLFMNINPAVIHSEVVGSGHVLDLVESYHLKPHQIVLEIIESQAIDLKALLQFIHFYRNKGFYIAIDDMGNGYSNMERILQIKPDVLKIDRGLIENIDQDYYKQASFKALVDLARKIGAIVIAEGIERAEEALTCLSFGADWLQGYYFLKPQPLDQLNQSKVKLKASEIGNRFQDIKLDKILIEKEQQAKYSQMMDTMVKLLRLCSADHFEEQLKRVVPLYPRAEYVYILDKTGIQQTESIAGPNVLKRRKSGLYHSATKGANQSLRDYYLYLQAGSKRFITEGYLSLATGNICVTYSQIFQDQTGEEYVLCADFTPIDMDEASW